MTGRLLASYLASLRHAVVLALAACGTDEPAAPSGPPEVVSIEPAIGSVVGGEFVTLRGANLQKVAITIGGVPCTDVASGTEVASCRTGAVGFAEGTRDVVVHGAGGDLTLPAAFTYQCPWLTSAGRRSCGAVPPANRFRDQPVTGWVTQFQAGHGYVANPGAANLADTTDHALGAQSVSISTDGTGTRRTLTHMGGAPIDFSRALPKLWIKVDGIAHAAHLELRLGDSGLVNYFTLPFEPHQSQSWITDGDWVCFTLAWNTARVTGTPDRNRITDVQIVAVDDGAGRVTLHANGLALVREPTRGALSFTFDDGFGSQTEAMRILDGLPATAYVIVDLLDQPGRLSTDQLVASGWQVSVHTFTDAHHAAGYAALDPGVLEDDLVDARAWLIANGFTGYDHCAYPHGEFDRESIAVVDAYFASCRTIYNQAELAPPSDPRKLRVLYVTDGVSLADAEAAVDEARDSHAWLVMVFHDLVAGTPAAQTEWRIADFSALVDHVAASGIPVATVDEVLASW